MTRNVTLVGFGAITAVAVLAIASAVVGGQSGGEAANTIPALAAQIQQQSAATSEALALVENIWVPRIAGLGLGLAVGLLGGGLGAYVMRGESR